VTVAMQWFGKHVSTIEAVFPVWSMLKVYRGQRRLFEVSRLLDRRQLREVHR
jgi:hypothetical protein